MAITIKHLTQALYGLESSGRHRNAEGELTANRRTGAAGISQIMPENWNPWSIEVFGKSVPQTEAAQKIVTEQKLQQYWDQFGSPQAALAAWFAGPDDGEGYARGDRKTLQKSDGNMTVEQYVNDIFNKALSLAGANPDTPLDPRTGNPGEFDADAKLNTFLNELMHGVAGGRRLPIEEVVQDFTTFTDLTENVEQPEEVAVRQGQDPNEEPMLGFFDPTENLWDFGPQGINPPTDMESVGVKALINTTPDGAEDLSALMEAWAQPSDTGLPTEPYPEGGEGIGTGDGQEALDIATQFLGVPYLWGGESPKGFDCSGLLQYVFNKMGIKLPRVSYQQAQAGVEVKGGLPNAQVGDLIAFASPGKRVSHIGMYAGNGKMLHAPRTGKNVEIVELGPNRINHIAAIRRVTGG